MGRTMAFLVCALASLSVHAGVTPEVDRAMAFRGASIVLPLLAQRDLPTEVVATYVHGDDERTEVTARTCWFMPTDVPERRWADPMVPLAVSSRGSTAAPHLVVPVPDLEDGTLLIGDARIELTWHEMPPAMPAVALGGLRHDVLQPDGRGLTTPSFDDPFEAWRVELIAARQGLRAPPIDRFEHGDARAVALQRVAAWRTALHRLHAASPGVARGCVEQLTAMAHDDGMAIAAWVTEPGALAELLGILLTSDPIEPTDLAQQALAWIDRQAPVVAWLGAVHGDPVEVAIANARRGDQIVEMVWAVPSEIPMAQALGPGELVTLGVDPLVMRGDDRLLVEVATQALILPVHREVIEAEPPGVLAGPFSPPRVLAEVRLGAAPSPPAVSRQTFAQFRRLTGAWEVMIEARWPSPSVNEDHRDDQPTVGDLRGHECVLVVLECQDGSRHEVLVTPDGVVGANGPSAHVRVFDHAWLCRLVLPSSWIDSDVVSLALARGHGDAQSVETWPSPGTPWKVMIDPIPIDLSDWDQGLYTD